MASDTSTNIIIPFFTSWPIFLYINVAYIVIMYQCTFTFNETYLLLTNNVCTHIISDKIVSPISYIPETNKIIKIYYFVRVRKVEDKPNRQSKEYG